MCIPVTIYLRFPAVRFVSLYGNLLYLPSSPKTSRKLTFRWIHISINTVLEALDSIA